MFCICSRPDTIIATYNKMWAGTSALAKAPRRELEDFTENEIYLLRKIFEHEKRLISELESTIVEFEDHAGATCSSLSWLKKQLGGNMEELSKSSGLITKVPLLADTLKICKDIRQKSLEKLGAVCCSNSVSPGQRAACKNEVVRVLNLVRQLRSSIKSSIQSGFT